MSGARSAPRLLAISAIVMLVVSIGGFVTTMVLNAFVLDKYDEYGEVPVPGSADVHLPAGEVHVSFHTQIIGSINGGGLPVPNLSMNITPPSGVAQPEVTENVGGSTTVNGDTHRRVWVMNVPAEGTYNVAADGPVNGFISPRLAFGHSSSRGSLVWVFVALFAVSLVDLAIAAWWSARLRRRPSRVSLQDVPFPQFESTPSADPYTPTDEGVRLQQLKTITALRDSGALTQQEFEAEKHRILDG